MRFMKSMDIEVNRMQGKLYLCATPIGNLEDISYRVLKILKEADLIAAEDTRHSIKLLNRFDIKTPMTSYHEFNKIDKAKYLVEKMKAAGAKVDALDCLKLAEEAGSAKAVNIVLMGRLSHYFDLPGEAWQKSLEAVVPPKFLELNKKAFELGKNA